MDRFGLCERAFYPALHNETGGDCDRRRPADTTVQFSVVGATDRTIAFPAVHAEFAPRLFINQPFFEQSRGLNRGYPADVGATPLGYVRGTSSNRSPPVGVSIVSLPWLPNKNQLHDALDLRAPDVLDGVEQK